MAEIPQPGVEIVQVIEPQPAVAAQPTLVPVVVGPAFEVLNVLGADGAVNPKALFGPYAQAGKLITQSSFPNPRGNIAELDVLEDRIRPFLLVGGSLSELFMDPGESFYSAAHLSSRAAMKSKAFGGGLVLLNKVLVVAIDQKVRTDTSKDVVITFSGTLTAAQAAAEINAAIGLDVATVVDTDKVQIASPTYGADSSVTVRQGGSANSVVELGYSGGSAAHEERVVGAGFRGQDDSDGDLTTPWIEFYRGGYILDGAAEIDGVAARMGWYTVTAQSTFTTSRPAAVTFGSSGTYDLRVGDQVFADGARVNGGEVSRVEPSRFRIGTINAALSTVDSRGRFTSKVYDPTEVGVPVSTNSFDPAFVWFRAAGLQDETAVATAAVLTGLVEGVAATAATVVGGTVVTLPAALAGLTIVFTVTVDGVETDGTFTFTGGPFATVAAIATAISIAGVTASDDGGKLRFTTTLTGRLQAVTIRSTGTANSAIVYSTSSDTTDTGSDVEYPPILDSGAISATTTLTGTVLDLEESTDGGTTFSTTVTHTFTGELGGATPAADLAAALNANATWFASYAAVALSATLARIYSRNGGATVVFRIKSTTTAIGVTKLTGLTLGQLSTISLNGTTLKFTTDDNPHVYEPAFVSNSVELAADEIDETAGFDVAATLAGTTTRKLKLTSGLKGIASKVVVLASSGVSGAARESLGLTGSSTAGTGRPFPDAYLDDTNSLAIGAQIVRDQVTGYPLDQTSNPSTLYIQYKALRKDVSPLAARAGVLRFSDVNVLGQVLDPLTEENPLGLGLFLAMNAAPNVEVKGLGIDEVSAAAPDGIEAAWARAQSMLSAEESYAIAPLTPLRTVHQSWATHVVAASEPEQGGERIVFAAAAVPTEAEPVTASSGTQANSTATSNQLLLDSSPAPGLTAAGVNPALPLTIDDGAYVEVEVSGELRRYLIASVTGSLVAFDTTFLTTENVDGFYSSTTLTETVVNAAYAVKVRGAPLVVPGSSPARTDYAAVAAAVAAASESFANRRVFRVFPGEVKLTVGGIEKTLPAHYASAALAGMVSFHQASEGFTNRAIPGLTGTVLTGAADKKFTKQQLDLIAGGGTFILHQEEAGGAVTVRHQLSTDTSSIEARELSITKSVDLVAKRLRRAVRSFIGTSNVNDQFLDTLGAAVDGALNAEVESGNIIGYDLVSIEQDASNPDTVLLDVVLTVLFPANRIRIKLIV